MAKNSDLDILLTARVDINKTQGIKDDVKALSTKMQSLKRDGNVHLGARLNTDNRDDIVKDVATLSNKLKSGVKDGSLLLKARLNIEDTKDIAKDIKSISSKLKDHKIELNIDIKDTDLKSLKKEIGEITKSLSDVGAGTKGQSTSGLTKGLTDGMRGAVDYTKKADSAMGGLFTTVSKVVQKFDSLDNGKMGNPTGGYVEYTRGVGENLKRIEHQNKIIYEQTTNQAQAQADVYKRMNGLIKDEASIRDKMKNARGQELDQLQEMLNVNQKRKQDTRAEIDGNKELLYNKEREMQLQKNIGDELDKQLLAQAQIAQREAERIDRLGKKVSGDKGTEGFDSQDLKAVNQYVQSLMGAEVEVNNVRDAHTRLRSGISDTSKQMYEVTAQQQMSNGKMKEFTFIVDENSNSMYQLGESIKPIPNQMMGMVAQMGEAIIKSAQWAIAMDLIYGNIRRLKEGIEIVKQLDGELTQVAVTTGQTREQTKAYADTLVQTSIDLHRTVADVSAVNTELVRQGLSVEEAARRMETVMQLSSVGGMDSAESLKVITSSVNALGEDAEKTADVLVRAGQISASSASEIGEAFTKTASSAKATGVELEELGSMIAVLVEVTQESPSSLGNSLKTLIQRFNAINEETGEVNQEFNKVQTAIESVGVAFTDAEGQIRPMYQILQDLSVGWDDLDQNTRSYVATQAAGTMQANRFIAIMDNFGRVQEVNNDLMGAAGTLAEGYDVVLGSVAAKADRARASFEGLWIDTINSDVIGFFYDLKFAFTELLRVVGLVPFALAGVITALQVLHAQSVLNDGAFSKWTSTIMKSGEAIKATEGGILRKTMAMMGLDVATKKQATTSMMNNMVTKQSSILQDLLSGKITATAAAQLIFTKFTTFATGGLATMGTAILGVIPLLVKFAILTGGLSILTGVITSVASGFMGLGKSAGVASTSVADLNKEIGNSSKNVQSIRALSSEYQTLTDKMGESRDITQLTSDQQERYNGLMEEIEQIAPNYITYVGEQNTKMIMYGKTLDDIIEKEEELIEVKKQEMMEDQALITADLEQKEAELEKKQKKLDDRLATIEYRKGVVGGEYHLEADVEKANTLKAEMQELNAEMERLASQQAQIMENLMSSLDDVAGASDSMIAIAKDSILEIMDTEGFDAAKNSIDDYKIILEEASKAMGENAEDFDYSKDASDRMREAFTRLGMDEPGILGFLSRLAMELGLVQEGFGDVAATVGFDMDEITKMQQASDEIAKLYEILAKGDKLTTEQLNQLVLTHEEIAEYVAETGDITLEQGEKLRDILFEMNASTAEMFETELKGNEEVIQRLERRQTLAVQHLETIKASNKVGSAAYQDAKKDLDDINNKLQEEQKNNDIVQKQLEALQSISAQGVQDHNIGISIQGFEQAQAQLESYRKILQEIEKTGTISAETNRMIIRDHHELIGVLGDDVAMRELIQEKIIETEEVAKHSYRNMLLDSESFYKTMLTQNADTFNAIGASYGINLSNFTSMGQAMAAVANQTATEVKKAMSFSISQNAVHKSQVSGGTTLQDSLDMGARSIEIQKKINTLRENRTWSNASQTDHEIRVLTEELGSLNTAVDMISEQRSTETQFSNMMTQTVDSGYANASNIGAGGGSGGRQTKVPGGSKRASSGSGKGSSGSSSSVPLAREVDRMEILDSVNAYLRWEQAILRVNDALQRHDIALQRSTGEDRIALLDKENRLIKEKQKLTASMSEEYRKEQSVLNNILAKRGIKTSSPTGGTGDMERIMMDKQKELDSLTSQINAIKTDTDNRDALIDKRDDVKDDIDGLKADFDRYIEVVNILENNSNEWWELQSKFMDNQLARIEEGLKKYDDKLEMFDQQISLLGRVRENKPKELEKELELLDEITKTTREARMSLNQNVADSNKRLSDLEKQLVKFGSVRNAQYKSVADRIVFEKQHNKALTDSFMKLTVDLNKAMEDATDKRIEALRREKDAILENIDAMTEMAYIYDFRNLEVGARDIQHQIDVLNDIFKEDVDVRLVTTDVQQQLDSIKGYYDQLKGLHTSIEESMVIDVVDAEKIEVLENAIKVLEEGGLGAITNDILDLGATGETVEDIVASLNEMLGAEQESLEKNQAKADALDEIMQNQAKLIMANEEEARKLKQEIEDLAFSYKEIEASLRNKINLKEEELKQLQEQHRREENVRRQMEKQLELLRALDDTRHSYISGTGEEVFTYDVSAVNKLKTELDKMKRDNRKKNEEDALKEEIEKMKEELTRTIEINKLDIATRQLQLTALEENTSALRDLLGKAKTNLEDVYDDMSDNLVDEWKLAMEAMIGTHERLWTEYLARMSIGSVDDKFQHQESGGGHYDDKSIKGKVGESLADIAKAQGVPLDILKKANPHIEYPNANFGSEQNIKVPHKESWDHYSAAQFDTGGYTGSWGSDGKMAMLHQKELVLNKMDTKNLLDAVDITRSMADGLRTRGRDWSNNRRTDNQSSNQEIHIANVNLPSVKDGKSFVNELHGFLRKGQNRLI